VSVRIIVAERHDVVRVPLEAVTRDEEDRPIVSVPDVADVPHPRLVRIGLSNNKLVEIKTNLSPGERVVLPDTQGGSAEEP
jgi:multidrug efflux pump subunit AcrA (membrane-fusion protein)